MGTNRAGWLKEHAEEETEYPLALSNCGAQLTGVESSAAVASTQFLKTTCTSLIGVRKFPTTLHWREVNSFVMVENNRTNTFTQSYFVLDNMTSLVAWSSELLTTNHDTPGSIPGSAVEIFSCMGRYP
jgi:hypothetical protein